MTGRMRVCMLSFYFHPSYSGSAVQAHALSRELRRHDIEPTIVSANLSGSPSAEVIDGIPLRRLPLLKLKPAQVLSFEASLAWFLWRHRREFDVVHAHGAMPHGIAGPLARRCGRKSILKIAMARSDIAFHRQGRLWGGFNRWCARHFDRYIATSSEAYAECLEQGFPSAKVLLIPNGVDTERFRPARSPDERRRQRAELKLPEGMLACFVGILDARKNVDGILRVWSDVRRRTRAGHLLLIGPHPEDGEGNPTEFARNLRSYVAANGLESSVSFVGQRSDVAECLRCADIFFFPSRREGMPNVLLEAMASGLACVTSSIGGNVDLVEDGVSGRVFALDDEAGMAACIALLIDDPSRTSALGLAARERAEIRFSLGATACAYADLYRELLGRA